MHSNPPVIPTDLRQRLEEARLDNLALIRALDRLYRQGMSVSQPLLHTLYELEADCGEGLWALDQPPGRLNTRAMVRDTLASLDRLPTVRDEVRAALSPSTRKALDEVEQAIRATLDPREAYSQVPGRDPDAPAPKASPVRADGPRVGRNDPCPCGSGKKYKKCCALQSPTTLATEKPAFHFEPGSYGGRGGFFSSIACTKVTGARSELHFVLVKPGEVHRLEDDALGEARRDLDDAFSDAGGNSERVAIRLRDAGYFKVDDPRIATD
jgi:hypothetical protein